MFLIYNRENQDYYNHLDDRDYRNIAIDIYLQLQYINFKIITALDKNIRTITLDFPCDLTIKDLDVSHIDISHLTQMKGEIKKEEDIIPLISQFIVPDISLEFNDFYDNTDYYLEDILLLTLAEIEEIVNKYVDGILKENEFKRPYLISDLEHTDFNGYKVIYISIDKFINVKNSEQISFPLVGLGSILGLDKKLDFFIDDN